MFALEPAPVSEVAVVAGGCEGFAGLCLDWEEEGEGEDCEEGCDGCLCLVVESLGVGESFGWLLPSTLFSPSLLLLVLMLLSYLGSLYLFLQKHGALNKCFWPWRTTRYINVYWNNAINAREHII